MEHTANSRKWWILAVVTLVAFMTNLDGTIVVVGLPRMVAGLQDGIHRHSKGHHSDQSPNCMSRRQNDQSCGQHDPQRRSHHPRQTTAYRRKEIGLQNDERGQRNPVPARKRQEMGDRHGCGQRRHDANGVPKC